MGLFDMSVGAALQVATHGGGAAAHEGADGFKFEQGLGIALIIVFEVIAKDAANGGFHGVRLVLYLFSLYPPYRSRFFPFFQGLFSVPTSRREAGPSNAMNKPPTKAWQRFCWSVLIHLLALSLPPNFGLPTRDSK